MTFQEHFQYTRALTVSVKRVRHEVQVCAVQHASYSPGKTFLFLDPAREFSGSPDGCAVPRLDLECTMGILGREQFLMCGYPSETVVLTGSPRYERPMTLPQPPAGTTDPRLKVLLLTSLSESIERDLIEAACVAAEGLLGVSVRLPSHPMAPFQERSWFRRCKGRIAPATGTLTDAVADADVVLYTYSTVAEEAWIAGKCVWQWSSLKFRGSALSDVASIPTFSSNRQLREALCKSAGQAPSADREPGEIDRVRSALFGPRGSNVAAVVNALERWQQKIDAA